MTDNGELIDDGGPEVIVRERDGEQALWVRVGPVYSDGAEEPDPGIWIYYQETYMGSDLLGPVLLTKELWGQLNEAVRLRSSRFRRNE